MFKNRSDERFNKDRIISYFLVYFRIKILFFRFEPVSDISRPVFGHARWISSRGFSYMRTRADVSHPAWPNTDPSYLQNVSGPEDSWEAKIILIISLRSYLIDLTMSLIWIVSETFLSSDTLVFWSSYCIYDG